MILISLKIRAQIITTFAGGGTSGLGDGGTAISAIINDPNGAAFDSKGNFYFVENLGSRVRKVDMSGIIVTVAGNGTSGYNGDNIQATSAEFEDPEAVTFDTQGNFYIADGGNRIRKVNIATGIITTFAGTGVTGFDGDNGPATSAKIYEPSDICFDNFGNLYIADYANYRIRKVNTSGVITTYAGIGTSGVGGDGGPATAAQFILISGIAIDNAGNLFIADWNGGKIRKVNTSGIITTYAGTGSYTYNGDNIPATSANIAPVKIAFNRVGELYIVDNPNDRIRKVGADGIIHTVAGNGMTSYSGDGGLATLAAIGNPGGIAVDSCGNIFISEVNNPRIRKVAFNPNPCPYLSVNAINEEQSLSIYPNPTYDILNINNLKTPATYTLQSIVGATIQQGTLKEGNNSINIQAVPNGMYMLVIVDSENGKKVVNKIIKQ